MIASLAFNLTQYLKKFCFLIIFLKISILCLFIYFSIKLSWYLVLNHGFNIFTRFGLNFFHYFLIFLDIEVVIIILNFKKKCIVDIFSTIKKKKNRRCGALSKWNYKYLMPIDPPNPGSTIPPKIVILSFWQLHDKGKKAFPMNPTFSLHSL